MNAGRGEREARPPTPALSPCIKVCAMDAYDRYCTGCARTRHEIATWWSMSEGDKRRVLGELPARGDTRC